MYWIYGFYIFLILSVGGGGGRLDTSESDVWGRQILMSESISALYGLISTLIIYVMEKITSSLEKNKYIKNVEISKNKTLWP